LLAGAIGYTLGDGTKGGLMMGFPSTYNGEDFARATGANDRTFRRWLRKREDGVGQGFEYDLPKPDSPEGPAAGGGRRAFRNRERR